MLRFLRIRNLAVIESVEVEFDDGFNVLTGETGAGKSILVGAVGLLLGARASADLVRSGEAQASIEALFDNQSGTELIVRREISSQGRSRSFINGTLATASAVRDLAERLVELHGQHEHQALLDPLTHLPVLDRFANLQPLVQVTASSWATVRTLRAELDRSRMDVREKAARLELIDFQLGEIERASPRLGEDDELLATKQVLANAERLQRLCSESYAALYDRDDAVLASLAGIWKRVGELATIDASFAAYLESRDAIKSQLEDLAVFLRSYADGVDASPARLQQVEDRLVVLERLKRKYGPTLQDVIDKGAELVRERDLLSGVTHKASDLRQALSEATAKFLISARELSQKRRTAAVEFGSLIESLLVELAMNRTRFEVRFNVGDLPEDRWSDRGVDEAEFFVSPNPGEELRPLARIVSGGELSRVMLALKTLSAADDHDKTLIFDEVDAGIGGRVADVVGGKLADLGRRFQVLCITHLPHIAARATTQFRIEKALRGNRTVTSVARLDDLSRVDEIARMIGGLRISDAVRASARELLVTGAPTAKSKAKAKGESESRWRRNI